MMPEIDTIKRLEELTNALRFRDMHGSQEGSQYEICTERGTFIIFGLAKDEEIAIARAFASKNTLVPYHFHNGSKEWMGVSRGKMKINFRGRDAIVVSPGDAVMVSALEQHSLEFDEDTWLWAVTVPGDRGFPCKPHYGIPDGM
jgi:quercetin dioxygenase-like cupin family protein